MNARARQTMIAVFAIVAVILIFTTHGAGLAIGLVVAAVLLGASLFAARSREPRMNRAERRAHRTDPPGRP